MNQQSLVSHKVIGPTNHDSWLTLLEAAKVRKRGPVLLCGERPPEYSIVPDIWYNRQCRSLLTMKRELEEVRTILTHHTFLSGRMVGVILNARRHHALDYYEKVCVFCQNTMYRK